MEAAISELKSTPLAALGGAASFLALLVLIVEKIVLRRLGITTPERTNGSSNNISIFAHAVLWSGSAVSIAYLAYRLSPVLGLFAAFGAYGITIYVLTTQTKNFSDDDRDFGSFALALTVGAIFFGVFWEALLQFAYSIFQGSPDYFIFGVFLIIGGVFLTFFGVILGAFAVAPEVARNNEKGEFDDRL